ncbi:MAG: thioredoxin domain-containing protein [Actinomycetaceae bacterium]|nr:thioredoxin domain-containing protein [Actinomycetaceae bacterium]
MRKLSVALVSAVLCTMSFAGCGTDFTDGVNVPMPSETSVAGTPRYITYDTFSADPQAYTGTKHVLFFTADWCAECLATDVAYRKDPSLIPDDVTLIRTDFDLYENIRQLYEVTIQHTFVQIDGSGTMIKRWAASNPESLTKGLMR